MTIACNPAPGGRVGLIVASTLLMSLLGPALGGTPALGQAGITEMKRVRYESDGNPHHVMNVFIPPGKGPFPGVIVIHGGGWRSGNVGKFTAEAEFLAEQGFVAFAITYRLAPQSTYPAQLDDVEASVRYVRSHASLFRLNAKQLGALGGSAGAQLAALLGTVGEGPTDTGARVRAVVSWSGPMNLSETGTFGPHGDLLVEQYLGCPLQQCPETYREASPVTHVDPTDPPMFIANSTNELVPLAQAQQMVQKLRAANVPVDFIEMPGTLHAVLYESQRVPDTNETVLQASVDWLRRYVMKASKPSSSTSPPSTVPTVVPTTPPSVGRPGSPSRATVVLVAIIALIVAVIVASVVIPLIRRLNAP